MISYDRIRFHGVWRLFNNYVLGQYAHDEFLRGTGVFFRFSGVEGPLKVPAHF